MEWPAAPEAGDLPSKEFNFSRGIKGTLALRDLFGLLAHLELTRAEQHYIVDLCLGLKGATKLYGLLGKGEKPAGGTVAQWREVRADESSVGLPKRKVSW